MNKLSNTFLRLAVFFALIGVLIGYGMGATHDHTLVGVHAHINLLGWVSMFLYGLFYRVIPGADGGLLPKAHFWSAVVGFVIMTSALAAKLLYPAASMPAADVGLIVGPTLVVIGMILFAVILFRATGGKVAAS